MMGRTKGFITIATGAEEYYHLARNLLHSYRYFCNNPLPFTLLCDRDCKINEEFDNVLFYRDGAACSYLDKLKLSEYLPYDETIFIDADCLAYGDLNFLFDIFADADDMSCFGRVLPLQDKSGWFEYDNLGVLKSQVSYVVGLHGGIYYMRKGEVTSHVFQVAQDFALDYSKFKFKGNFNTPGDEPLIALAMAVNNCHPIPFRLEAICCYWEYTDCMDIDITEGRAEVRKETTISTNLLHWGTRYTRGLVYKEQIDLLAILESADENCLRRITDCKLHYGRLMAVERWKEFANRLANKAKRMVGYR